MIALTIGSFFAFTLLGVPIAFALGLAALAGISFSGGDLVQLAGKVLNSIDSFPLMAIPLFVLSGELMIRGKAMGPLIDFANAIVGRMRGGLALVAVQSTMVMSAISGVAVADATAIGGTLGRPLEKAYGKTFSASLVATASCMGPIIPPSAPMILYAILVGDVSVAGMFLGGVVPGLMIGIMLMVYSVWVARRRGYPPTGDAFSILNLLRSFRIALPFLAMPVVVIGGIIIGAFTATEGAAIAVLCALMLGFLVTRQLTVRDLLTALGHAASVSAIVGALIAFSSSITHIFTLERVGEVVAEAILHATNSPMVMMALVCVIILILGMFIEGNSMLIMTAPILAPVAVSMGIDPVYFGVVFVFAAVMGTLTPPVGILLFVVSSIWKVDIRALIKETFPMFMILLFILALIVIFPDLILALPRYVMS